MTFLAVRYSGRPPDRTHLYGHGKMENLSAMAETLLLLVTCAWIVREAFLRLAHRHADMEVTFWSFAVMGISIAVDVSRARVLSRTAKKHNSQALEADALHFQTDVWSSAVVIAGLIGVKFGFAAADAVAALGVCAVVVWVSGRLGKRTVDALLDTAPAGLQDRISEVVQAVPGVHNCHALRIRYSGPVLFIDLHVLVDGRQTLFEAHELTERIEEAIAEIAPGADVTVHPEPI
jgi:cation diffusion facilitator family transporter